MKMQCKNCDHIAKVARRYKGHEYRYCKYCNLKYMTNETENEVIIERQWTPSTYEKIDKKGD